MGERRAHVYFTSADIDYYHDYYINTIETSKCMYILIEREANGCHSIALFII